MILKFLQLFLLSRVCNSLFYDSYTGKRIDLEEVKRHDKANNTYWCVTEIEPCDPKEYRRVDGSCNNLENPVRGARHTPFVRILPPIYSEGFEPRKGKSGNELPPARKLRTSLLSEGRVPGQVFTQLAVHALVFMTADVLSPNDTVQYLNFTTYCCTPKGRTDRNCVPNSVPNDDPVFRFTDIRCLNMTKPLSFQSAGCIPSNTTPERIVTNTPHLDLSAIYGVSTEKLKQDWRLFEGGLLKFEISNGKIWPPSTKSKKNSCIINDNTRETRCHAMSHGVNVLAGTNLVTIWFWRLHNVIARKLAAVNSCWDDDTLFHTARDINIAILLQIYYYELLPALLGHENLIKDGLISPLQGFRDVYDKNTMPQISVEFPYALRWVHTIQDGYMKMYDKDGYYLKKEPIVNLTLRTGFFDVDDNIDHVTLGTFRQGTANFDYIIDPDLTSIGLGLQQRAFDISTNDLAKTRYFGFQPYIKYREFCFSNRIKSFEDLRGIIDIERIEILKQSYESVEDIELIAGIWLEKPIKGGYVPSTFYCLVVDQFIRNMVSDRHWYERSDRPNAFTLEQLLEIRKYTVARLLCDVGDSVTKIQPRAFFKSKKHFNEMRACNRIPDINYQAWRDNSGSRNSCCGSCIKQ